MKKVITMFLLWYLLVNASEPTDKWIVYLTEDDGTVHKCKREDYLEMMEMFNIEEKNDRLEMHIYYCWEKDYNGIMLHKPKRKIDYGQLQEIKDKFAIRESRYAIVLTNN